jgi:hypothetical protein
MNCYTRSGLVVDVNVRRLLPKSRPRRDRDVRKEIAALRNARNDGCKTALDEYTIVPRPDHSEDKKILGSFSRHFLKFFHPEPQPKNNLQRIEEPNCLKNPLGSSIRWKSLCFFCKDFTCNSLRQILKQVEN